MINANNYFREIEKVDISKLPEELKKGHNYISRVTQKGKKWTSYETSPLVQETIDKYLELLNKHLTKKKTVSRSQAGKKAASIRKKTGVAQTKATRPVSRGVKKKTKAKPAIIGKTNSGKNIYEKFSHPNHKNFSAIDHLDASNMHLKSNISTLDDEDREARSAAHFRAYERRLNQEMKTQSSKKARAENLRKRAAAKKQRSIYHYEGEHVERMPEELKFIKRFVLMHNKSKTLDQIRAFINSLQKAMTEKRIRKTSQYAAEILQIQDALLELFAKLRNRKSLKIEIGEERRAHFLTITGSQRLLPSVRFIKNYITLQGKRVQTAVVKSLLTRIEKAQLKKAIPVRDPYAGQINEIVQTLKTFVSKNKVEGTLLIPSRQLNGLNGIIGEIEGNDYEYTGTFNGFGSVPDDAIVNTMDIVKMRFKSLGFTGKWLRFIGDPAPGFTAMVFGLPKFGKSYLCIDWAGYLARNHGRVLYVAREEKIGDTLSTKIRETKVAHPNFDSVGSLPYDLSGYDFVFLDSVTKLGLSPDDLDELKTEYPEISFIYVFQTTKQGAFRGSNGFQHDVDIVIEVPEPGKAVQYGRYNQGGEMAISF